MKVSVVMPVYKVEPYLSHAVHSVLAQTESDLELILVDDCSPDGCPALCDSLAGEDPRIRVIHKPKNEGLGFARNTGLEAATGDYVIFMDSDDAWEPNLLERTLSAAGESDITVFGVTNVYENADGHTTAEVTLSPQDAVADTPAAIGQLLIDLNRARVFPFAWNKLYRRDFLVSTGIEFESTRLIEDFLYNIQLFPAAHAVTVIPDCLYRYRRPAHETLVTAYSPDFFNLVKRKYGMELEFLKETGRLTEENRQFVMNLYIRHLLSVFMRNRNRSAGLKAERRLAEIRRDLADAVSVQVLHDFHPGGLKLKVLTALLRGGNAAVLDAVAGLAVFAQTNLQGLFRRLRQ